MLTKRIRYSDVVPYLRSCRRVMDFSKQIPVKCDSSSTAIYWYFSFISTASWDIRCNGICPLSHVLHCSRTSPMTSTIVPALFGSKSRARSSKASWLTEHEQNNRARSLMLCLCYRLDREAPKMCRSRISSSPRDLERHVWSKWIQRITCCRGEVTNS